MAIPEDTINQIRESANIVEVIGQYVQLKKAGKNWKGLCPFHGEKTPSFNVQPDKGFFMCFGCQKKGDVFDFVMELEGKSFVEAVEQLGARFNIEIPKYEENPELRRMRGERVAMLELNKLATQFYRELLADPKHGEPGRAYLNKRGVGQEVTDKFLLGYAPGDWGLLAEHLTSKRADMELAVRVGLIAHRPRGGFYDRNRDRLVCPVVVPGGDVVGFSSRVVGEPQPGQDPPPKYINSPESAVYKKSKLLFGLAQAREAMASQKRAVLVEGNFDVITLHQAGFNEVIAPLGTALTPEQVNVLKRLTEKVVLLYDGDKAGYKATLHALQLCIESDVEVLIAQRPGHGKSGGAGILGDGVDPDSLVAGGGAELLREAVDRAKGGIEFFIEEIWTKGIKQNVDARGRAIEDAAKLAAKVANPAKHDLIVGALATSMQVDPRVIQNAIARAQGRGDQHRGSSGPSQHYPHHPNAPSRPAGNSPHPDARPASLPTAPPSADEIEVMSLLSDYPELIGSTEGDKAFWLLTDERLRAMYSGARAGKSVADLAFEQLPPELVPQVLSRRYADHKDPPGELAKKVANLGARKAEIERTRLMRGISDATRGGNRDKARLLSQLGIAERQGDHELAARLRETLAQSEAEAEPGKQVD
jgi:DNA primase